MPEYQPTPWQNAVLSVPEQHDLALTGGRGGAKSTAIAFELLRHCEQWRADARCLYLRRSHAALEDFSQLLRSLFSAVYGSEARYNGAEGIWRLPGGAYIELSQLSEESHYHKFQGRSFSRIAVDEATQHASPRELDLLRSNLRSRQGVPNRFVLAANPGGPGHAWVRARHVNTGVAAWHPYIESDTGANFVSCPSTYLDNPFIDQDAYRRELEASCAHDPDLLKAWLEGDWSIARGAYFADVVSEARVAFGPWTPADFIAACDENPKAWATYLAHDFGSTAPSATYLCVKSWGATGPDDRYYPPGSILLLDELVTNAPGSLNEGMRYSVGHLADLITALSMRWGMDRAHGVADDAIFAQTGSGLGSIAEEFYRAGVEFDSARKGDRVGGWQLMREMLANAGKPDVPGLYVSRACTYWWETAPSIPRDPRRLEDVDTRGPDHGIDAARYALVAFVREPHDFGAL